MCVIIHSVIRPRETTFGSTRRTPDGFTVSSVQGKPPSAQQGEHLMDIYSPCLGYTEPLPPINNSEVLITLKFGQNLFGSDYQILLLNNADTGQWDAIDIIHCTSKDIWNSFIQFNANTTALGQHLKIGIGSKYGYHQAIPACSNLENTDNLAATIWAYPHQCHDNDRDDCNYYYDLNLFNLINMAWGTSPPQPALKSNTIIVDVELESEVFYFSICGYDSAARSCVLPTNYNSKCDADCIG
eukprot:Nk52_evm13s2485 gene=Nk52_evmTU13s2485